MEKIFLATCLVAFLAVVSAQQVSELKCHFCESEETPDCEKQPENVLQVSCKDLKYDDLSRSATGQKQNTILSDIFKRESSRALTTPENIDFKCITVDLKENDSRNFIRTCAPHRNNIDTVCDFIREQVDTNIKIGKCSECNDDFCNSAFSFSSSLILQLASAALAWFLVRY